MDPNELETTAVEAEADEALSPGATDGASSSGAAAEPEDFADVIRKEFLEKYGDGEETPEPEAEAQAEPEAEAEQKPEPEETDSPDDDQFRIPDDQFKALPDGVKKRLGHLNTRAKKAERELGEINAELPVLKEAHQRFTTIQNFIAEHQIEPDNVSRMFDMAAMLAQGKYQDFLDAVKPFYDYAAQAAGVQIAPELQKRVEDGYLTEEDARALTQAQVETRTLKGRVDQLSQRSQAQEAQRTQGEETQRMLQAINNREAELKSSDPDYAHKSQAMKAMIGLVLENGGVPKDVKSAVALIDKAYERVNASFTRPTPPKPTTTMPRASTPSRGQPPAASFEDAVYNAVRAAPQA